MDERNQDGREQKHIAGARPGPRQQGGWRLTARRRQRDAGHAQQLHGYDARLENLDGRRYSFYRAVVPSEHIVDMQNDDEDEKAVPNRPPRPQRARLCVASRSRTCTCPCVSARIHYCNQGIHDDDRRIDRAAGVRRIHRKGKTVHDEEIQRERACEENRCGNEGGDPALPDGLEVHAVSPIGTMHSCCWRAPARASGDRSWRVTTAAASLADDRKD